MGSGNPLLKRLARDGDERPAPRPRTASAWGAEPSAAAIAADRALLLVALTLVSGVLVWWFLTAAPRDSWQAENAGLIGLGAFTVVVAVVLIASVRPLAHPGVACLFALAQGVLFASVVSAFEVASPGLFGSVLLGSTLTTLCALALRRAPVSGLAVPVRIAVNAAGGLVALVVVNAVVDLDLFGPPVPWFAWAATVVFAVVAAYSVHADLLLVDDFATADDAGQRIWAAALGLTAGVSGMYVWRFFNLRARDSSASSSADSGSDWGSGSDSGSDSGGSSSD